MMMTKLFWLRYLIKIILVLCCVPQYSQTGSQCWSASLQCQFEAVRTLRVPIRETQQRRDTINKLVRDPVRLIIQQKMYKPYTQYKLPTTIT